MQGLKRAIKKVAAIGTGVAMLGATVTSAFALDLADYPAPFVKDGVYDQSNAFVVGAIAAAADTLGAIDISTNLQFESKTCVPGVGTGSVQVSGDAVEMSDPSDLLEIREPVGDVRSTITEVELDGLRGGVITTDEGTTEWDQFLRFEDLTNSLATTIVNFTKNDDPDQLVQDFMFIPEGNGSVNAAFFEYELRFGEGLESVVASAKINDLEDEELILLGQTYSVVDTSVSTANNEVKLELMGGAIFDTLEEGEVKTYTLNGKDYKVEVVIIEDITPATVTFRVNGEVTDQLTDGETETLSDGTLMGISDVLTNEAGEAGSGDLVEFYLGATKLELRDNEYIDSTFEQNVEVNNENIEDAWVQISANELTGDVLSVSYIKYRLVADALPGIKDLYIPAGHGVREYLDEPEGMLGTDWDLRYEGLDDVGVSIIKFDPSGDDSYNLVFENRQGQVYNFPLVTNDGGTFKYGDEDDDLVFGEANITTASNGSIDTRINAFNIGDNDFFLLSNMKKVNDETAYTHVVRYSSIDTSSNELIFDDLATGSRKFTYTPRDNTSTGDNNVSLTIGKATLVFGGNSYITYIGVNNGDYPLAVDQNGNGTIKTEDEVRITTNGGALIDLGNHSDSWGYSPNLNNSNSTLAAITWGAGSLFYGGEVELNISIRTLSSEFDEDGPESGGLGRDEIVTVNISTRSGNNVGINRGNAVGSPVLDLNEPDEDDDHFYGMTDYGSYVDLFDESGTNDAETLTVEYPLVQRGSKVFVTMGSTTTTRTKAGEVCTVANITPRTLQDNEVSEPTDYNLILTGDSCVNKLVADLWKVSFPTCGDGLPYGPGEASVELMQNGDKVAMVVAGWDAIDTRTAAKVVANYEDFENFKGMKVKVTGTLNNPVVSPSS